MSKLQSARIAEVVVTHHPRERGQSKYGISRVGKVLLDVVAIKMLISFRHRPLQWFSVLSIPFFLFGSVAGSLYVLGQMGGGPATVVSPIAFMLFTYLAVYFFFVGLLAELVVRAGNRRAFPKANIEYVNATH